MYVLQKESSVVTWLYIDYIQMLRKGQKRRRRLLAEPSRFWREGCGRRGVACVRESITTNNNNYLVRT